MQRLPCAWRRRGRRSAKKKPGAREGPVAQANSLPLRLGGLRDAAASRAAVGPAATVPYSRLTCNGMDPGRVREHERNGAPHRKDRRALLELPDGPPRDLERLRRFAVPHTDLAAAAVSRSPPRAQPHATSPRTPHASARACAPGSESAAALRRARCSASPGPGRSRGSRVGGSSTSRAPRVISPRPRIRAPARRSPPRERAPRPAPNARS